jgi:radical SAM superfamily enzyme YgiQ (UPF0313 family)
LILSLLTFIDGYRSIQVFSVRKDAVVKILVLNPPFPRKNFSRSQRSPAVTRSGTLYFPMWLAYAAGVLEDAGHEVRLVDAPAQGMDLTDTVKMAREFRPALTIMDTSTPSIDSDLRTGEAIKGNCPRTFLILVGPHVSALPGSVMSASWAPDGVAVGEYDFTLRDLADAIQRGRNLASVDGIVYRTREGAIKSNPMRQLIRDLDTLPMVSRVYRKHLDHGKYFNPNGLYPMIAMVTGRGCPNRCSFCLYPATLFGRRYRYRTIPQVVEEFEYIVRNFPDVKSIFLEDDTLTANRDRCRELAAGLKSRGITIPWTGNSRADVDRDTLAALKGAGLTTLCVGFESGSQEILDNVRKGIDLEQARDFARNAADLGIRVHGCFIFGLPGETEATMEETIEYSLTLPLETAQFYPLMVYPGTDCYEWARKEGFLITQDFSRWLTREGYHNCVVSRGSLTPSHLVRKCNEARRRFYLRPSYIYRKMVEVVRDPSQRTRVFRALATFWPHLAGIAGRS